MATPRLIIVSNRLPITIKETDSGLELVTAPGGMAAALAPIWKRENALWVGWPGIGRPISRAEFEALKVGPNLAVLNLSSELYRRYYDAFSNGSLWPVLHGYDPRAMYEPKDYEAVREVNERFARVIEQVAGPDDVIWIHDFHLALLPAMLRARGLKNRLGYFLHVPFPQGSWFDKLPDHIELAESMTAADVVGVQTERDAFNLRAYLKGHGMHRPEAIGVYPVGIDYARYHDATSLPAVQRYFAELKEKYEGKTVLFSASRLDYTKGLIQQLKAVRALLEQTQRRDLIYKVVVAPSREALSEYREVNDAAAALAKEINQNFGRKGYDPVEYSYRNHGFEELIAWYERADVMLVTPLMDGMNLIAKEYVAAHGDVGMLVLGEHAGAAAQLPQAVLVDPYDAEATAAGLRRAVEMGAAGRTRRMRAMRATVRREDVFAWADRFLSALWVDRVSPSADSR
jgi:trehalose 6-phosphate synthase/phosphatase